MQIAQAADIHQRRDELTLEFLSAYKGCKAREEAPEPATRKLNGRDSMNSPCYSVAMDLGVCQLRNFSISFLSSLLGTETSTVKLDNSSSGASVVAIDNKIEQAMVSSTLLSLPVIDPHITHASTASLIYDLVKSHLMYAVREEVEVLKEQIKELLERNSQLEQENNLLKNLASPEQMAQFQAQVQSGPSPPTSSQGAQPPVPAAQNSGPSA
ncbi:hypothetical protein DNTS_030959 [Danionella cerebrum]|uniref:TSC22 domain family protein 1 n=1 Tax=Danionella cerebrum TaxID=2873325 RepID=A0A553MXS0_9TELE|nr:hypothetical protein DNTS_030959 [Danionella translucida]